MAANDTTAHTDRMRETGAGERPLSAREHRLIVEHTSWACEVVRRLARRYEATVGEEDVTQLALEGLTRAARAFDPSWGVPFAGFAIKWVRGTVLNAGKVEKRFHGPLSRECEAWTDDGDPMEETEADALGKLYAKAGQGALAMLFGIAGMRSHEAATGGEEAMVRGVLHKQLHELVATIPERPREVIVRRYIDGQPIDEVAQDMRISVSTVRRDCDEWLPRLGRRLGKMGRDGPS